MSVQLHCGDCLPIMAGMEPDSFDTILTDPPYGLSFMGKDWDRGVPGVAFWQAALRVAKPGAMLLAFGGTRTWHRLAVAIEDAGWEIRDCLMWITAQGFPKSMDISKQLDKMAGADRPDAIKGGHMGVSTYGGDSRNGNAQAWHSQDMHGQINKGGMTRGTPVTDAAREWAGYGTALKPAWEPIILAMKPVEKNFAYNALAHGVAGLNIDGCRIPVSNEDQKGEGGRISRSTMNGKIPYGGGFREKFPQQDALGRWPANLILGCACDGDTHEPGCACALLDAQSGERKSGGGLKAKAGRQIPGQWREWEGRTDPHLHTKDMRYEASTGGASRFYFVAKASRRERNAGLEGIETVLQRYVKNRRCRKCGRQQVSGAPCNCADPDWQVIEKERAAQNFHPTVKPLALMRYLCRLTRTPSGGTVLDPFMGSGSTGVAAVMEGRSFVGIELESEYLEIAQRRIEHAQMQLALPLEVA